MRLRAAMLLLGALAAGCTKGDTGGASFERMLHQSRADDYEASDLFRDGAVMRRPPPGTIPREHPLTPVALVAGIEDDAYATRFPVAPSRALVERGRDRFAIYCQPCHGSDGDGRSAVATQMTLRRPTSLVAARVRALPPGRLVDVMRRGYGMMPSYASALSADDRWAVAAYVEVLQLRVATPLADLPEPLRAAATAQLARDDAAARGDARGP